MEAKRNGKLRTFIRKRWPILFVGTLLFLALSPILFSNFMPDPRVERIGPYWMPFLIHDLLYLYPMLAIVLVGVLVIYMGYRLGKHDPDEVSFSLRNIVRLQNIILAVLLIPLVFLLTINILLLAFFVRPLHLDNISYGQHEYHVVLDISPSDDWGTFFLFECEGSLNLRCQGRYRLDIYYRHRTVLASGKARLMTDIETNMLSMCLFDGRQSALILNPFAPRDSQDATPLWNDTRCAFLDDE